MEFEEEMPPPSNVDSSRPPPIPKFNNAHDVVDIDDDQDKTQVEESVSNTKKKSKRVTSKAWDYFEKIVVNGEQKAKCYGCKAILSADPNSGTSHLNKHAEVRCPSRHLRLGGGSGQTKLSFKTESDGSSTLELKKRQDKKFDQEFSRKKLVNMVVMHEYPLSIVDHIGFRMFVESLNPDFKMISRNTLRSDIMKTFESEKVGLKELLNYNSSRIAITTDLWTASNQKKGYMVVTSHFIDQTWTMRSRTLRFSYVPCPHTKEILAKVLMDCVTRYGLQNKISSIVVDNCTTNDAMMDIILDEIEPKTLMLGGRFLHMRCSAHILNLIVKDGLDVIYSGIEKIRDCVSFWMLTPKRIEKFEAACKFKTIAFRMLVLDCKTRWNSTYLMLQSAIPYKEVFVRLKRLNPKWKFDLPSDLDWQKAQVICDRLEIFFTVTKIFSGRNYPTSNMFFRKICQIRLALDNWLLDDVDIIRDMASNMILKYDKYWKQINGILAIATILDPRNKMDCVEYYFRRMYGDGADNELERIRKTLDELVLEYQKDNNKNDQVVRDSLKRARMDDFDEDEFARAKKTRPRKASVKHEVDHYLEDEPMAESDDFDVLSFWKTDQRYPTLRKIARDLLAIPVSTVASESAFSMGGRVVSPHRSRLHAKTVEALMCMQQWMTEDIKGAVENAYACATMLEDSDNEDGVESMDIIEIDLDDVERGASDSSNE